jgi:hypothetical protein
MQEFDLKIGDSVQLLNNPNQVEITYIVDDLVVYVKESKIQVMLMLRPDKDYPIPDTGMVYKMNNLREENVLNIKKNKNGKNTL